jgi:hypothetical protein
MKWFRDVVLIPVLITLVGGFGFMIWGAWYSGVKWHSPFSTEWLKAVWTAPVPIWIVFVLLVAGGYLFVLYRRSLVTLKKEKTYTAQLVEEAGIVQDHIKLIRRDHAEEMAELQKPKPKLHVSWGIGDCHWGVRRTEENTFMLIIGRALFSTSDVNETIYLTSAYIKGTKAAENIGTITVAPSEAVHSHLSILLVPLIQEPDTELVAKLIFVDSKGRAYETPEQKFEPVGQFEMKFLEAQLDGIPPAPELTLVWRFFGWCWTKQDGEMAVRLTGDGFLQVDNVPEKVLMVDVRIEGAERVGIFDNFELEPGQRIFRGIGVDFKDLKPNGKEPITAVMTFVDFKGNLYPVKETTFKPLSNPERFNGISWANM